MDLNKVLLMGRLTRDLEIRYVGGGGGTAVCDLPLAVNHRYRRQDGEQIEETCYIDVTVWGKQAESCNQYLNKGSAVFVEGRLKLETWETDGQKRSKHKVIADRVQFMPRSQGGGGGGSGGGGEAVDDYGQRYSSGSRGSSRSSEDDRSSGFGSGGAYHDENVPF